MTEKETSTSYTRSPKSKKNMYRKAVSYLYSFMLSVLLLLFTFSLIIYTRLFSESTFLSLLDEDYYTGVMNEIVRDAEDVTIPTGIDLSVIGGVFTYDGVKKDVDGHISAAFNGYNYTPKTETYSGRLYDNVKAFLDSHDVTLVDDESETIAAYIKEIDDVYAKDTKMPGLKLIMDVRNKYVKLIVIAIVAMFVISVAFAVLLIKLFHYRHRSLRYISYALGGTALMSFAAPFWLYVSKFYEKIQLSPEFFYKFMVKYISTALRSCLFASLIWFVLFVLCIVLTAILRTRMLNKRR